MIGLVLTALAMGATPCDCAQSHVEEGRPDSRALLHSAFVDLVQAMESEFAQEDHAMIVGRKFSVDWSLAAALLIADIVAGAPPAMWLAQLDDGYGHSAPLLGDSVDLPQEVADGCELLRRDGRAIRFEYLARRVLGTGAEVPAAITWQCEVSQSTATLRTAWYEPQLAQRGIDFPLPPDRTVLSWSDSFMRVRVLGESIDWSMHWPTTPPLFDHVGDAYDLFDGLRAWRWSTRGTTHGQHRARSAVLGSDGEPLELSLERLPGRHFNWQRCAGDGWMLIIGLRPASAIRRAGYIVKADGVDESTIPIGRPQVLVPIVPPFTVVRVTFRPLTEAQDGFPQGAFLPTSLVMETSGMETASSSLHSFSCDAFSAGLGGNIAGNIAGNIEHIDPAWLESISRIRSAQESNSDAQPFSQSLVMGRSTQAILRARLAANAWTFAMHGDLENLMTTLNHSRDLSAANGLAHHELTALQTFAESLVLSHAPDASLDALRVRHAIAATQIAQRALADACLAATGSGRFWAALDIAQAALAHSCDESPHARLWQEARQQLLPWCASPAAHIAFGSDPAVLLFGESIAGQWLDRCPRPSSTVSPPDSVDGLAAGDARRVLKRILDRLDDGTPSDHS